MRYLSVCSGIEAATVAWAPLRWSPVAFSEIEAFPCAVLANHYPNTPNWGDMERFCEWPDAAVDLLVGGTPCQSFSVAGLRAGLDDPRGNLALVYLAIAARYRPKWLVWENVPGFLSSDDGRAMGSFLGALAKLGYGYAYRVLDAQYVRAHGYCRAVPQRRRRVFIVGYLGDWGRAAAVLFDTESLSGNPPPRREAGQKTAGSLAARAGGGGRPDGGDGRHDQLVAFGGNNTRGPIDVATAVNAHGGPHGRQDFESETFVAQCVTGDATHALTAEGHDASEDGTGRGVPVIAGRLSANGKAAQQHPPAIAFHNRQDPDVSGEITHALGSCDNGLAVQTGMAVRRLTPTECERLQGFPDGYTLIPWKVKRPKNEGGPCAKQTVRATLVTPEGRYFQATNHVANPQRTCPRADLPTGEGYEICRAVCQQSGHAEINVLRIAGKHSRGATLYVEGHSYACDDCLAAANEAGVAQIVIGPPPGNAPDGPRYKALGNSMAVSVMRWIGTRIAMVNEVAG